LSEIYKNNPCIDIPYQELILWSGDFFYLFRHAKDPKNFILYC
jgi:hypothetical protein